MFQFIDSLVKVSLRSETRVKLKKIREDLDKDIKEDAEKEKKEEVRCVPLLPAHFSFLLLIIITFQALDAKAAAKRKAEEERIAKLSPAEQKKVIN